MVKRVKTKNEIKKTKAGRKHALLCCFVIKLTSLCPRSQSFAVPKCSTWDPLSPISSSGEN